MTPEQIEALDWDKQGGLLPAVVQDARNHRVLMLGYMNRESLQRTMELGQVTFYSRSKQRLWTKGESSGNVLQLMSVAADCDRDSLLIQAIPHGPTCHRGTVSCFDQAPASFVAELDHLVEARERERPADSYTTRLFEKGVRRIAQKVGEEGVETALAAVAESDDALLGESGDLVYHLLVLLRSRGLGWNDVQSLLAERHAPKAPAQTA